MTDKDWPRLDKTKITITSSADETEETKYWLSRSPDERFEAIELMRQMVYGYDPATTRLQRVLEIIEWYKDVNNQDHLT